MAGTIRVRDTAPAVRDGRISPLECQYTGSTSRVNGENPEPRVSVSPKLLEVAAGRGGFAVLG